MRIDLPRRAAAECLGTALLLAAVVGSGIMGERLAGGNTAIALLANTIATAATLYALIVAFSHLSGAHLNPAVTLVDAWLGGIPWREVPAYVTAQICGAFAGVACCRSQYNVRGSRVLRLPKGPHGTGAVVLRICCHIRTTDHHSRVREVETFPRGFRRRRLHRGSLLVHGVDFFCEPRGDSGTNGIGYLRRYSTRRCAYVHRGTTSGRRGRDTAISMDREK